MSRSRSIPEKLIKIKAEKIWKKRQREGKDGTSKSDWNDAIHYFEKHRWVIFLWKVNTPVRSLRNFWSLFGEPNNRDFALEVVKTLGISLTAFGLLFSVWEGLEDRKLTQKRLATDQERLVTDRFSKAVEQLGKHKDREGKIPDTTVRIGGIYALERIANDSNKDFWTIMEVLTSYVRENSSLPPELKQNPQNEQEWEQRKSKLENLPEISIDIQAALTVIKRRKDIELDRYVQIDLTYTNLKKAQLKFTNLQRTNFSYANLQDVFLDYANLQRASLRYTNLRRAQLGYTELQRANLDYANLQRAQLGHAELQGAQLTSNSHFKKVTSDTDKNKAITVM